MLLGLNAQRSPSQGFSVEMKQIAVKQLDLLRHVATGFQDQTDHLQQISDDIGTNLNALAQGFVKLGDVLKDLHARARVDGQEFENRHKQLLDKLESQNVYYGHIRTGVNKMNDNMKNLCWSVEELRTGQWQDRRNNSQGWNHLVGFEAQNQGKTAPKNPWIRGDALDLQAH